MAIYLRTAGQTIREINEAERLNWMQGATRSKAKILINFFFGYRDVSMKYGERRWRSRIFSIIYYIQIPYIIIH